MIRRWAPLGAFIPFILIALGLISGCGSETVDYLDPPIVDFAASTNTMAVFSGSNTADPDFLGFDIFYRMYASQTDASADADKLTAQLLSSEPIQTIKQYLLGTLKYSRIALAATETYSPSIEVPSGYRGTDFDLNLWQDTGTNDFYLDLSGIGTPSAILAFRSVKDTPTSPDFLPFSVRPLAGAPDFSGVPVDGIGYFVQFYVASYGFNIEKISDIFSSPVLLKVFPID